MQTAISEKQGRSGLGIEAQRNAIARFADAEGFDLIDEFVEVESGKGSDVFDNLLRGRFARPGFLSHLHSLAVTMSQKSSPCSIP